MQKAIDAISKCQRNVQTMTSTLAGTKSDTVRALIQRAQAQVKELRDFEDASMLLLCDINGDTTDMSIWVQNT